MKLGLNRFFLFSVSLLVFLPSSIFGIPEIENKTIIAESINEEIFLSLDFGEYQITPFDKLVPTLDSGLLVVGDRIVEIIDARAKIMGNSFVIHSENILIYAKSFGEGQFTINTYLIGSENLEPIKLASIPFEEKEVIKKDDAKIVEMIVLVRQDIRTFWNDTYDLEIKVFDKEINPQPQFYQSLGAIDQANIDVLLKDSEGEVLTQFTGKTDSNGFWEDDYFVLQNIVPGGTYTVEVNVNYLDSNNFQKLETFIVSDTRSAKS